MNKRKVDEYIPEAFEKIKEKNIAVDRKIKKTYLGQIATFGAAIQTGSLLAAVSFFNQKGSATVERQKLINVIEDLLETKDSLFEYIYTSKNNGISEGVLREEVVNAAVAIKLAMNLYELEE